MCLLESFFRIDQDLADVVSIVITQGSYNDIRLLVYQERRLLTFGGFFNCGPDLRQIIQVPLHFLDAAADTCSAHDDTHAFGHFQLRQHFLQLVSVLALDAPGDAAGTRILRHGDEKAAGETDEAGEGRALVAAFFFFDLDDDFLVDLERVLQDRLAVFVPRGVTIILLGDFLERQKTMTLGAVVDKCGFEAGLYPGNFTLVDI